MCVCACVVTPPSEPRRTLAPESCVSCQKRKSLRSQEGERFRKKGAGRERKQEKDKKDARRVEREFYRNLFTREQKRHIKIIHIEFLTPPGRPGVCVCLPANMPFFVSFYILNNRKSLWHRPVDPCLSRRVCQGHPAGVPAISLCGFFFPDCFPPGALGAHWVFLQ